MPFDRNCWRRFETIFLVTSFERFVFRQVIYRYSLYVEYDPNWCKYYDKQCVTRFFLCIFGNFTCYFIVFQWVFVLIRSSFSHYTFVEVEILAKCLQLTKIVTFVIFSFSQFFSYYSCVYECHNYLCKVKIDVKFVLFKIEQAFKIGPTLLLANFSTKLFGAQNIYRLWMYTVILLNRI